MIIVNNIESYNRNLISPAKIIRMMISTTETNLEEDSDYEAYTYCTGDFMSNHDWQSQRISDLTISRETNIPIDLHEAQTPEDAQRLIHEGYDINQLTEFSQSTPLLAACKQGRVDVVHVLISKSMCDKDLANKYGERPLFIAVITNNKTILRALLNSGANPYAVNNLFETLLHKSVQLNFTNNLLPILLEHIDNNHINKFDIKGRTALRIASTSKACNEFMLEYDPFQNVQLLLCKGANPNLQCNRGYSPLHVATFGNFTSTVSLLVDYGANVNSRTAEEGQTALHTACASYELRTRSGSNENIIKIAQILIHANSDINTVDNHGNSILHSIRSKDILQCLLSNTIVKEEVYNNLRESSNEKQEVGTSTAGAYLSTDSQISSNSAGSSLSIENTIQTSNTERDMKTIMDIVDYIRQIDNEKQQVVTSTSGGNLSTDTQIGSNSAESSSINEDAIETSNTEKDMNTTMDIVDYQITTLDNINLKNSEGNTPLHIVVTRPEGLDMIQCLVNAKADIYAVNNMGQSCLHTCAAGHYNQRLEVMKTLVFIGVDVMLEDSIGRTALEYLSPLDIQGRQYLQEVMDKCGKNADFKRINVNTNSTIENDEEIDSNFEYEDDNENNDN
jgi:ankyrin repeat protein